MIIRCLVWKKEEKIFFLCDSAVSSLSDQSFKERDPSEFIAFGEKQDRYDSYFVYERNNKITQINYSVAWCGRNF